HRRVIPFGDAPVHILRSAASGVTPPAAPTHISRSAMRAAAPLVSPRLVCLWRVHRFDFVPRLDGLLVRRAAVRHHKVGDEIHVAAVLDAQRTLLGSVELDRLFDQISVRDTTAGTELLLPPTIQQITGPRCALEARL